MKICDQLLILMKNDQIPQILSKDKKIRYFLNHLVLGLDQKTLVRRMTKRKRKTAALH